MARGAWLPAMTFTWSNGQSEERELIFEETGETTGHFTATAWRPIDGPALGGLLNLVLPESFDTEESDTVYTYIGDRDPDLEEDFPVDETGVASLIFNANTSWADVTVELVDFTGLTAQIDVIDAEWTFLYPDGTVDVLPVEMTETAAESCRFIYDLGVENIYSVSVSHMTTGEGTFLPFLLRIDAPEDVLTEETVVNTFDRDWSLKRLDFGDGEREYVVDDQENAVVFLPAAYAESHIQCMALQGRFDAVVKKGGKIETCSVSLPKMAGLFVIGDDVEDEFSTVLGGYNKGEFSIAGIKSYFYGKPGEGDVQRVGPDSDKVKTEIYWRYVGDGRYISLFNSGDEFKRDVEYRVKAIDLARNVSFSFPGEGDKDEWNHDLWKELEVLKPRVAPYPAVKDMFADHPQLYSMGCAHAAGYVMLRGAYLAYDTVKLTVDEQERDGTWVAQHWTATEPVRKIRHLINAAFIKDQAQWIPGDQGYVQNLDWTFAGNPSGSQKGINVFYLGGAEEGSGCFDRELGQFTVNSRFWCHGMGVKSLQECMSWKPNTKLDNERRYLRQPPGAKQ